MARQNKEKTKTGQVGTPLEAEFDYEPLTPEPDPSVVGGGAEVGQSETTEDGDSVFPEDDSTNSSLSRPRVLIDGEELFRVEGDILLDIDELDLYDETQKALEARHEADSFIERAGFGEAAVGHLGSSSSSLIGIVENGKLLRWAPGTVLSYCVLRRTFAQDDWYEEVAENMWLAANAWADTCGVEFQYVEAADDSEFLRPPEVLFPVRSISAGGVFIAAAFFPNTAASRRRLMVDPSYHRTTFDRVGVFRHELGHVLGFRHEQVSAMAPKTCPDEDTTGTFDLTAYDPKSVMHYFCGGVGSRELEITEVDRAGSQLVYGAPLSRFQLLEA
jgi:hypothetical protein